MGKDTGIQLNDHLEGATQMDIKLDIIRDSSDRITQGMVIGNTLNQNQALILITRKGEWKFRPDMGVGIEDAILDDDLLNYRHSIKEELVKDGMTVRKLVFYEGKPFELKADYGS